MLDNEQKILNKLYFISYKILKIYNTLYELEINNQKDSFSYKKNLNYLDLLIELENEIYDSISDDKIDSYIYTINNKYSLTSSNDFNIIINDQNNLYYIKRVYNKLLDKKNSYLINCYQLNNENEFANYYFINKIIHEDVLNSFIFETNNYINNTNNKDYQNGLLMIKYLGSYLNSYIEKMYKNDFLINKKLFLFNSTIFNNYNLSDSTKNLFIKKYYFNNIYREIRRILKKDLNANDYAFQKYRILLTSCLIKAYLAIDKNNIYLNNLIHDIINIDNDDIRYYFKDILNYNNLNIHLIESERLEIYGNSK